MNNIKFCLQSQVFEHPFMAAKLHLKGPEWEYWEKQIVDNKLVRVPFFRGTLHTLPDAVYAQWAPGLRDVIEKVTFQFHQKKYGVDVIRNVWFHTRKILMNSPMPIDLVVEKLSETFSDIKKTDLKYFVRTAENCVSRVGEAGNRDETVELYEVSPNASDTQSILWDIMTSFNQAYGRNKIENVSRWIGISTTQGKALLSEGNAGESELLKSIKSTNISVLPPFDPWLLAIGKDERQKVIDPNYYSYIWGRSGIIYGAVIANGKIVGSIRYKKAGKKIKYDISHWENVSESQKKSITSGVQLLESGLENRSNNIEVTFNAVE